MIRDRVSFAMTLPGEHLRMREQSAQTPQTLHGAFAVFSMITSALRS